MRVLIHRKREVSMRIAILLAVISLGAASLSVGAYADPAQVGDQAQAAASDADQMVCRTMAPTTGTRLGAHRECHSQREWDAQQEESQKALADKQTRGLQACVGSCGH